MFFLTERSHGFWREFSLNDDTCVLSHHPRVVAQPLSRVEKLTSGAR